MGAEPAPIRVECHAGGRGEEEPRRFWLGERRVEVREVIDRWLAPDHRYFKLLGDDGGVYILRHDEAGGEWTLTLFDARGVKHEQVKPLTGRENGHE